jgi:hypothetical protein
MHVISFHTRTRFQNHYYFKLFESIPKDQTLVRKEKGTGLLGKDETYEGTSPLIHTASVLKESALATGDKTESRAVLEALQFYRDSDVHLRVNVIRNPLLSADVCAQFLAKGLSRDVPLPKLYKNLLSKLSA